MNITYLLGNGFDLALGLNTRYRDFYDWYCALPSSDPEIADFKQKILADREGLWADFEVGLGRLAGTYGMAGREAFFRCYDDAQEKLATYLQGEEARQAELLSQKEINTLLLLGILREPYQELPAEERAILEQFAQEKGAAHIDVNFIVFNYTRTLERLLDDCKLTTQLGRPIHIHGYLDNTPIMGVNGPEQVGDPELCQDEDFALTMLKPQAVRAQGDGWDRQAEEAIRDSDLICVFGMSLGDTDKRWWLEIGKWLEQGEHQLLLFTHGDQGGNLALRKRKAAIREAKQSFLRHLDMENFEREALGEQIHVIYNTRRVFQLGEDLSWPQVAAAAVPTHLA